jgi:hypothetical protein
VLGCHNAAVQLRLSLSLFVWPTFDWLKASSGVPANASAGSTRIVVLCFKYASILKACKASKFVDVGICHHSATPHITRIKVSAISIINPLILVLP